MLWRRKCIIRRENSKICDLFRICVGCRAFRLSAILSKCHFVSMPFRLKDLSSNGHFFFFFFLIKQV